jgi:hypothetical protein
MSFSVPAVSADQALIRTSLNEHGEELITKLMAEVHDVAECFSIAGANIANALVPTDILNGDPANILANGQVKRRCPEYIAMTQRMTANDRAAAKDNNDLNQYYTQRANALKASVIAALGDKVTASLTDDGRRRPPPPKPQRHTCKVAKRCWALASMSPRLWRRRPSASSLVRLRKLLPGFSRPLHR